MTEAKGGAPVLGVDVGGTKVAVGLVDHDGKILAQSRKPMVANGTAEAGLQAVADAIDSLVSTVPGGIHSIGICAPGPLDPKTGVVLNPPNLPCWRDFPLAERIVSMYHVPVKVDNDANAAALAETRWGAARGYHYVFYATIGTGIGTGIVLDGRIYHGNTGSAGEGGHVSIDYRGPLLQLRQARLHRSSRGRSGDWRTSTSQARCRFPFRHSRVGQREMLRRSPANSWGRLMLRAMLWPERFLKKPSTY